MHANNYREMIFSARALFSLATASIVLQACSADRQLGDLFGPTEAGQPVVDGLLIVDRKLPFLYLRQTQPPGSPYSRLQAGIVSADVTVYEGDQAYRYAADPDSHGRHNPPPNAPMVLPETTYDLIIELPDKIITGKTHTPARVHIQSAFLIDEQSDEILQELTLFNEGDVYTSPLNQLHYQEGVIELAIGTVEAVGYQLAILSLDPDSDFVLEADFLENDDYEKLERSGSSPPLDFPEGRARLPWFAIAFGGRHLFKLYALDQNWFDYVRSSFQGGSAFVGGLAGDNFERPLFNIDGGLGLFGSASVDSAGFFVLPKIEN